VAATSITVVIFWNVTQISFLERDFLALFFTATDNAVAATL
jgi:hypothetical protein